MGSAPHPVGAASHTRRKDRISYTHEEFTIDLTQVTSATASNAPVCNGIDYIHPHPPLTSPPTPQPEVLHELELEITRPELLLWTATNRGDPNVSEHERSAFDELMRAFVNNARILVRNAGDGWL